MGANFTLCCCQYYQANNREEEKKAILRWERHDLMIVQRFSSWWVSNVSFTSLFSSHCSLLPPSMHTTTSTSRPPEELSSESTDSDTEEESLFGPSPPRRSMWYDRHSQRKPVDPWATFNRYGDSCVRHGSDRELQAFISMRDQADKATEVTENMFF